MRNQRLLDAVAGLVLLAAGVVLALRPFASAPLVGLLIGLALLAGAVAVGVRARQTRGVLDWLGAAVLLVVAAILLIRPGLSVVSIALIAGIALIASGAGLILRALRRGDPVDRLSDGLLGAAAIAVAVAALAWPGVTIFAAVFVVGLALIWLGLTRLYRAIRGSGETGSAEPVSGAARWVRLAAAVIALAVALPLAVTSLGLHRPAGEQPGDFYSAQIPAGTAPGTLLKSEPFHRGMPADSQAWLILYATTGRGGGVVPASALVVAPEKRPPGPRPVIAWAHGTSGIARSCAPSLLPEPLGAGATPAVPELMAMGAVLVATDYIGMGTPGPDPYLIGEGEAHSVLDSVRAARQLTELTLAPETVVWGHSQGGHSALWTGILAPQYAPDTRVIGVAALAPAAELTSMARGLTDMAGGSMLASLVLAAYSEYYDDVRFDDYVSVAGRLPMRAMATRCIVDPAFTVSVIESLIMGDGVYTEDPTTGPLGRRLAENTPSAPLSVPLLLAQGGADRIVSPEGQRTFVAAQCAAGTTVEFREYPDLDHLGVVASGSPAVADLLTWTTDRLAGRPAVNDCPPSADA